MIDYDRLVTGGPEDRYYVSFNNVQVGELIGQGEVDCIDAWKVSKPNILMMSGDPTDNNAKLFAQGYNGVLDPHFERRPYTKVGEPAGTWDAADRGDDVRAAVHGAPEHQRGRDAERRQRERGHLGAPEEQDPAEHVPDHGSGRAPVGLQNILKGYQCGTVYKPYFAEAQAAAALALFLRAGKTPPSSLVNYTTKDTTLNADIKSVYTKPFWVTTENMNDTVDQGRRRSRRPSSAPARWPASVRTQESSRAELRRASPSEAGPGSARSIGRRDSMTSSRERRRASPSPPRRLEELRAGAGARRRRPGHPGRRGDRARSATTAPASR